MVVSVTSQQASCGGGGGGGGGRGRKITPHKETLFVEVKVKGRD